jgi:signal transduction histidine kinase
MTEAIGWWPAAAAALALAGLGEVVARAAGGAGNPSLALLLALLGTVPLARSSVSPRWAAAAVVTGVLLAVVEPGRPTVAAVVAVVVATYQASRHARPWHAAVIASPLMLGAALPVGPAPRLWAVATFGLAAGAALAGALHQAHARVAEADARIHTLHRSLAGHQARGERARIARELHDVVAHHISLIALQSEAVSLTSPELGPQAKRLLADIAGEARTALTEMRRIVGVLRADGGADAATRQPQPGLRQLVALVEQARASQRGPVRLVVRGPVRDLDAGVELAAYRIVQEALTNARQHAVTAAVDVELDYAATDLRIRIRDNGPGQASGAGGYGLLGIRERTAMLNGHTQAGPTTTGGYLVEAHLPLPPGLT